MSTSRSSDRVSAAGWLPCAMRRRDAPWWCSSRGDGSPLTTSRPAVAGRVTCSGSPGSGCTGYFQQTLLRHVMVVHGVGVGGGSIVYAAVLLHPKADAWRAPGWAATGVDWAAELAPHYDTAAGMLGRQTNPNSGRRTLAAGCCRRRWAWRGPSRPPRRGSRSPDCVRCGACITGCAHGAKNSIDRTYLARAEDLGRGGSAAIEGACGWRGSPGGGWRLDLADPLRRGAPAGSITAREVVLSGGVLGTTELLLASRDRWRSLPWASPALGTHVRTNSEAFTAVLQPTAGPRCHRRCDDQQRLPPRRLTHVTNNRFPPLVRVHEVVPLAAGGR